ncbi:MAG: hypothetical protein QNJ89_15495 [Acidimicrobiia bacterium]|nr:hypothetical protein [Acidimicrobiia bacterium]
MNARTGAGIGVVLAMIAGSMIGSISGQWWWTGALLGIFIGIGWRVGADAEKRRSSE